jgi:hypothetical protein
MRSAAGHYRANELTGYSQEDLTPETTKKVLDAFRKGEKPKPGPQSGRHTSENSAGLTALTSKVRPGALYLQVAANLDFRSHTVLASSAHRSSARQVDTLCGGISLQMVWTAPMIDPICGYTARRVWEHNRDI